LFQLLISLHELQILQKLLNLVGIENISANLKKCFLVKALETTEIETSIDMIHYLCSIFVDKMFTPFQQTDILRSCLINGDLKLLQEIFFPQFCAPHNRTLSEQLIPVVLDMDESKEKFNGDGYNNLTISNFYAHMINRNHLARIQWIVSNILTSTELKKQFLLYENALMFRLACKQNYDENKIAEYLLDLCVTIDRDSEVYLYQQKLIAFSGYESLQSAYSSIVSID